MTTPYQKLLGSDAERQIARANPRCVLGDVAVRDHPQEKIRTIWWCTGDKKSVGGVNWECLGYADTGELGRLIVHAGWFTAFCRTCSSDIEYGTFFRFAPNMNLDENWQTEITENPWREAAMNHNYGDRYLTYGFGTLMEPRGAIPKRTFDWVAQGELIPEYKATFEHFKYGTHEYNQLKKMTVDHVLPEARTMLERVAIPIHELPSEWKEVVRSYRRALAESITDYTGVSSDTKDARVAQVARRHIAMEYREKMIHG